MRGNLTISKISSNAENGYMELTIRDEVSGIPFITAKCSLFDFINTLTGMFGVECDYELRGVENIGKERQVKTERIEGLSSRNWSDRHKFLAPYLVDGWTTGASNDKATFNHHNARYRPDTYAVTFTRFVDVSS